MEQDVVKADAGHVGVEKYIEETFESWAAFRPQYMIGSGNNKDCEEWFFDSKGKFLKHALFLTFNPYEVLFHDLSFLLKIYANLHLLKKCILPFVVGIVRDRPVPIPGSGLQLTNISHVRDLSSMLTLAVENPVASHGIFNCVSDRAVTLDGMAKLCAQAAGRPANIVHYDPKAVGIDAKKAFPFRNMVVTNTLSSNLL